MDNLNQTDNMFVQDDSVYNKKIKVEPAPKLEIGADIDKTLFDNIINAGNANTLDISALENFTTVSQRRDQLYSLIDTMCQDSTIAAILETYAEDATEYNDSQQIVWVSADDDNVRHYVEYLLNKINVDKHVFEWTINLCKYGDVYLRLYRKSDYEDDSAFFDNYTNKKSLKESVKIQAYSEDDTYAHYVEMMPNPAEYYELTKHGKTYGYIKAPVTTPSGLNTDLTNTLLNRYNYNYKQQDVIVYDATQFVHGALYDNSSRTPEEVSITTDDDDKKTYTYTVKRGQSLFYNVFKVWRELRLLETAILLNRITKSSVVRIVQVEVGAMDKNMVGPHLIGIKQMFEQKSALDTGKSITEYTNPGPTENNVYIPTRNGVGAIQVQNVGGDTPNITGLADLDYFKNKFYGALRIPKQFFGETEDGGGFDAGKSLSVISSRYAKMVKRIQNAMIQTITDMINLMLVDAQLDSYVNKFTIKMLPPTTQESLDRRDNTREKVGIIQDIMNILSDVDNQTTKLKILKTLLSDTLTDTDVISLLQEEIDQKEQEDTEQSSSVETETSSEEIESTPAEDEIDLDAELGLTNETSTEKDNEASDEIILPQPASLGQDFTNL